MTDGERQIMDCLRTGECLQQREIDGLTERLRQLEVERAQLLVRVASLELQLRLRGVEPF